MLKLLISIVLISFAVFITYIWCHHYDLLLNILHPDGDQATTLQEKFEQDNERILYLLKSKINIEDLSLLGKSLQNDAAWVWNALPLPDSLMPNINDYLVDLSQEELSKRDSVSLLERKGVTSRLELID